MGLAIEDYGLIGDTHTAALVGRDGSIDWLCLPRFDSVACFAKLLGDEDNGSWRIAPTGATVASRRRYRGDSLVLETEFDVREGTVRIVDCMPIRESQAEVVRIVEGVSGTVPMRMELTVRFGYGSIVPWVRRLDGLLTAIAGPDALALWSPVHTRGEEMRTVADFTVSQGQQIPFVLAWYPSHEELPRPVDAQFSVEHTAAWWHQWALGCNFEGEWRDAVVRSLVTLKALTYEPTGGIVAAPTTSLPETLGGGRNWDYRYCWLRDATLTLEALMRGGFQEEAMRWRDWLLRAVAGDPSQLQIMYGPAGERRLDEWEVPWLSGYEGSAPVRVGNAAAGQFQLDVYGEVMSALYEACRGAGMADDPAWDLQRALMEFLETGWSRPDDGIWEVRGPRRHFTHSKVMAWVAVDRAVRSCEEFGFGGPVDQWRLL
jgi:GH15 family glucan-1,4-alpha-glucosidase